MLMFFSLLTASMQLEINGLKDKIAAMRPATDPDLFAYDARVAQALERLTRATFGDAAFQSTALPAAFRQPGHRVEGEVYRFIALGDHLTAALPNQNHFVR
jgi:hypothetical protein